MNLDWCEHAGRLIQAVETQDFAPNLSKALREIVNFEYTVVFGYVGSAMPLALFNDFSPEREKLHVDEYPPKESAPAPRICDRVIHRMF